MKYNKLTNYIIVFILAFAPILEVSAQDWKSIFEGVASAVENKANEKLAEKYDTIRILGSWQYVKPDIKLESDDFISKAGSEFATQSLEGRLVELLAKVGINANTVITFNENKTYSLRTDKRTMKGTYSINKDSREITLTSQARIKFTAKIDQSLLKPTSLSLRFNADKLMELLKHFSGILAQKSANKNVDMVNTLLGKYNGLTIGAELKKNN